MEAKQTSLIDLLERIPQGARLVVEHDQFSSSSHPVGRLCHEAAAALRAALAQQAEPQTIDEAMRLPRAMAQAYEAGYKAGVAHEREACAQVCEARFVGDLTREDMEARRCAAAIRARGEA